MKHPQPDNNHFGEYFPGEYSFSYTSKIKSSNDITPSNYDFFTNYKNAC
jgi:hypothetical protein